ncbi:MAG TPA: tetratricopeptide repeat protein, partial [Candidatus Kapabacteria bacterium]|nr:tetratricopeptide repeat protein [Candidatus Kapabacteria bacterium]
LGNLKRAEMEFRIALEERPNYAFALGSIGRIRVAQKKYDQAITLLDSASTLVPEFSFAQLKADVLRIQGKYDEEASIIKEIEQGLAEDEASGHAMDREFAMLYATRGIEKEKAEKYARKEFAKRPASMDAQYTLALACYRSGKLVEAQRLMQEVLGKGSKNPEHLATAGLIFKGIGEGIWAEKLISQALNANPYLTPLLLKEVKG